MIEFDEKTWVHGIWYVQGDGRDWMGCLFKQDNVWQFDYRFRYYTDDVAHNSKDEKNWYRVVGEDGQEATRDALLHATQSVIVAIERLFGGKADYTHLDCLGNDPKLFFEFGSKEYTHLEHKRK